MLILDQHGGNEGRSILNRVLRPEPLLPPAIDPDLLALGPLERAGEVLRYSLHQAEFWLSQTGLLRAWLRFSLRCALLLGVPALLLAPVISFLLHQGKTWAELLVEITRNLSLIPAWLGAGLLVSIGIAFLWRLISGR